MTPLFGFALCLDQVKTYLCPFTAVSPLDKSNALLHVTLRLLDSPGIGAQYPFLTLIISIFKTANPRDLFLHSQSKELRSVLCTRMA